MAEYSGFFDGENLYGQDEFNRYFDNIYQSGVSLDDDNNMTLGCIVNGEDVVVSKGFAIIKGFYLYSDTDKILNISRDLNHDRIDRIVIRLNLSNKKITIEHKQGVAGSTPSAPLLQRDNLVYELSLCKIEVPQNGPITLTDERFRNELCGAIRPKNLSEIETMVKEFQKNWDEWFLNQQGKGWRSVYVQSEFPDNSSVGSIWIKLV